MDMYQALADPTRRHILEILAKKGKLPASDIYNEFSVSHPAISQHLKVLREAQLVDMEKKAQQRLYTINPKKMSEIEHWIHHMTMQWNARFDRLNTVLEIEKQKEVKNHGKYKKRIKNDTRI
jgi:DNA-binding transcriptional ArsR family regulator